MGKFMDIVGEQLEKFSHYEVSGSEDGTSYSTRIKNKKGNISRKLIVEVKEEEHVIRMRICISEGVKEKCSLEQLYRWTNKKQDEYYYARVYVDGRGDLVSDYQCEARVCLDYSSLEMKGAQAVYEILRIASSVMMIFTEDFEEFLKKNQVNVGLLALEGISETDLCLDPFQERHFDMLLQ